MRDTSKPPSGLKKYDVFSREGTVPWRNNDSGVEDVRKEVRKQEIPEKVTKGLLTKKAKTRDRYPDPGISKIQVKKQGLRSNKTRLQSRPRQMETQPNLRSRSKTRLTNEKRNIPRSKSWRRMLGKKPDTLKERRITKQVMTPNKMPKPSPQNNRFTIMKKFVKNGMKTTEDEKAFQEEVDQTKQVQTNDIDGDIDETNVSNLLGIYIEVNNKPENVKQGIEYDPREEVDYESFVDVKVESRDEDEKWMDEEETNEDKKKYLLKSLKYRAFTTERICNPLACYDSRLPSNRKNIDRTDIEERIIDAVKSQCQMDTIIKAVHSKDNQCQMEAGSPRFACHKLEDLQCAQDSFSFDDDSILDKNERDADREEIEEDDATADGAGSYTWFKNVICSPLSGGNIEDDIMGQCDKFECVNDGDENSMEDETQRQSFDCESKIIDFSRPTVLYTAIESRNWNGAIARLLKVPEEASIWVDVSSSDKVTIIHFLPLHIACLSGAPLLLVTLLVQSYPDAVREETAGKLPVHMACDSQADHRVVFLLLNSYPESLYTLDNEENTPIEVASLTDPCPEKAKIIQVLTKKMENCVVTIPTALYAAIDSHDWNYAIRRLVEMPQEVTTWVSFTKKKSEIRFLPLHAACLLGAPLLLIKDLVQAYPYAVRKKTMQGKLPLHIACAVHTDHRVIVALLDSWSDALYIKDIDGNTPLDIASQSDTNSERKRIMQVLMKQLKNPEDRIVFLPTELYSLIDSRQWDVAVRRLLEAPEEGSTWVGSCKKKTDAKYLPLHVACMLRAPLLLTAVLIQTFPEGVKKKTSVGKLPLHLACESRADHRVVSLLLYTWPESFHTRDNNQHTCVQVALLSKIGKERTKILETLVAFESRAGDPSSLLNPSEVVEKYANNAESFGEIKIEEIDVQDRISSDTSLNADATNEIKQVTKPRSKKKSFFGRKKEKNLLRDENEMFAP